METVSVLKVCGNPQCSEVAHNCAIKETHCRNCSFGLKKINSKTYLRNFKFNYFQRDYSKPDGPLLTLNQMNEQIRIHND